MAISSSFSDPHTYDLSSDATWSILYPSLRCFATRLVYTLRVSSWRGQEQDIIEDIVQETARRLIERWQKAEQGEAAPIHFLERLMMVIARNYCRDLRRRDRRLARNTTDDFPLGDHVVCDDPITLMEVATENVYHESLFVLLAHEVVKFPDKQRQALLIDLASRMPFDVLPTALQEAFQEVGIQLQEYQQLLPDSHRERVKHASLLNWAYRRIINLPCVKEYVSTM